MKNVSLTLALLACASPVAARPSAPPHLTSEDAARLLSSPIAQDMIATQIATLASVVLDTKVGPLAALADPRDHVRPDDTLHSIERRHDPDYDRHLYDKTRHAVGVAGAAAGGAVAEAAELQRTADRLRASLGPLIETVQR